MATKSGQQEPEKGEVIEELLDALDTALDRVKVLYEQYFLGIQKQPPTYLHTDIERKIRDLAQLQIRNTALRYRFATLQQKFGSYNSYWRRTLRQIESGTYVRNLHKVGRQAARSGADVPEEILAAMPKRMRDQVKRDREAALALARLRDKPSDEHDLLTLVEEDVEIDLDDETAAFIGESTDMRRNLLTATGAHRIDEADADFDLDAFFAAVTSDGEPEASQLPLAKAGRRRTSAPPLDRHGASPPPQAAAPAAAPAPPTIDPTPRLGPLVDDDWDPASQAGPAAVSAASRVASSAAASAAPTSGSQDASRGPAPTPPAPSPKVQPSIISATPRPVPRVPAPRPPRPVVASPAAAASSAAAASLAASPSPPVSAASPAAASAASPAVASAASPAVASAALSRAASRTASPLPGATPPPLAPSPPPVVSKQTGLAPSQATRAVPVMPGAAAARTPATAEVMAGPFPRLPSLPPLPMPRSASAELPVTDAASSMQPLPASPAVVRDRPIPPNGRTPVPASERPPPVPLTSRIPVPANERTPVPTVERPPVPPVPLTNRIPVPANERTPVPTVERPPVPASERPPPVPLTGRIPVPANERTPVPTVERPPVPASERPPPVPLTGRIPVPANERPPAERPAPPARPPTPARRAPEPRQAPPPGMSDADVNALYAKYVKAKQILGEEAGPGAYGKLLKTINAQAPKIMEQYNAKGVDFSVVVKDNQVIIRAKPKP